MKSVSVFGNEIDDKDNTALKLVPLLIMRCPHFNFLIQDPTESIEPVGDPWIILDTAIGISEVTTISTLDDLEMVKGSSVHDFDVYMELRLQAKLKPLPDLKIILVPQKKVTKKMVTQVIDSLMSMELKS